MDCWYPPGIPPSGTYRYLRYNVLMAWAIRTIYTYKCVQMDSQQLPKMSKVYSICRKCDMPKTVWGWIPPPLGSLRVNKRKEFKQCSISKKLRIGLHQRVNLAKY